MSEAAPRIAEDPQQRMRCTHRDARDDFFCVRYQVWYASEDCAIRTRFRTCEGCKDCEQGRFNLKRHSSEIERLAPRFLALAQH